MKVRVEVVCLNAGGDEQRRQVLTIERRELAMETLGMNLTESKALLAAVQDFVVAQQAREELEQRRACPRCRRRYTTKDSGSTSVSTVFGRVEVPNPRWNRCGCQTEGPQTFRPMRTWLNGQTSPEMLYLETKWASLIPFARATDLLKEALPVGDLLNAASVRNHLQLTAERIEQELGQERQLNRFEGSEQEWERQPLPDGPITVGIDGGYVRAAHKQGWFEVIAGKSVVAFQRDEEGEVPSAKCFGFVQTYDKKPRRRLWELMKSQGMQENQQVVFMSDGGENVRRVQEYLHPFSEHLIDWFHITMRLTVLQQQTKALQEERPETRTEVSQQLESVKHLLWHGNTEEALERLGDLLVELSFIQARSNVAKKVADGLSEFETYICNNREFIPNFGERRRQGGNDQHGLRGVDDQPSGQQTIRQETADAVDAARGPSFAADQDEGPQRGSGRPIPSLVSKIQVATTNAGAKAQGGLTPDFLALSFMNTDLHFFLGPLSTIMVGLPIPG